MTEMQNIITMLFEAAYNKRKTSSREKAMLKNVERYRFLLGKNLTKKEKKLLLRIIDKQNLIIENTAICNFTDGFKLGVKFGLELDKK